MSNKPESSMAEADEDNWHNITDAKQRKKIQDKLAQRARRKRLREAKNSKSTLEGGSTQITSLDDNCPIILDDNPQLVSTASETFDLIHYQSGNTAVNPSSPQTSSQPSLSHELPYPLTVFSALYINGQILGIPCRSVFACKSSPAPPDVPIPLQPTPTQLLMVHFNVIDRFPFPKMRDNFINMSAIIDEEDFTCDLFTKPSFTIKAGATSWDPRGWKAEKPFAEKWGFLFY